jgi:hypothetical protein
MNVAKPIVKALDMQVTIQSYVKFGLCFVGSWKFPWQILGSIEHEKDQQRMPMDATFYSSVSALNSRAGSAPIFQRGSKWVEPLSKMRMWQEAYGAVAMALENKRRAVTRWQGGIYSPQNSTQDCKAPDNYDKLSTTKSSSLVLDQFQTPLGWTFMSQLLLLFGIGIGISVLGFLLELAVLLPFEELKIFLLHFIFSFTFHLLGFLKLMRKYVLKCLSHNNCFTLWKIYTLVQTFKLVYLFFKFM